MVGFITRLYDCCGGSDDSLPPEEHRAMQEQPSKGGEAEPPVGNEIEELARRLREAEHLEPEARAEVADLLGDLAEELDQPEPSDQTKHLARSTAQLVRAVNEQHEPGLIDAARERVEEAVARAEANSPVTTEIVLRLIDVLSSLGI